MKTIKGICIKKRNFDKFKKVADLIYFDGPLLSHYVTNKGDNYLFYWIDQDDTNNRWMFIRTDYDNIQKYTNKKQTLRNVLSSPLDDIVYTVDIDRLNVIFKKIFFKIRKKIKYRNIVPNKPV